MKNQVKFDRKVNIRTRDSDRSILCSAIAVTLVVHLVFFGLFDYRLPQKLGRESGSAVVMLSVDDLPRRDRKWFRRWLEYHDPRNSDFGEFSDEAVDGLIRNARPENLTERPAASVAAAPPEVDKSVRREVRRPGNDPALPPPRIADVAPAAPAPPRVTDGSGRALPTGGVKFPALPQGPLGRTVLQVFKAGDTPALLLERSCGDSRLDRFAMNAFLSLAQRDPAPEFIVVEWRGAEK